MARIEDLIQEIADIRLKSEISQEVARLKAGKQFGLVYEEHLPEYARLPTTSVSVGSLVARRDVLGNCIYRVQKITGKKARLIPIVGGATSEHPIKSLVVVKRFGDPIFPALRLEDEIRRDGKKPTHSLICADNFHALQALKYCCEKSVDVIYIDPPYNTGARAWKYNNDYVDSNDQWRHSKWLSMMKRRLELARDLLKIDGVLIITIDENEQSTLGLLLREIFPSHEITPISIVHNPRGIQGDNFSYCHETAYFVIPAGLKRVGRRNLGTEDLEPSPLRKWGTDSERKTQATCFYPIYFKAGKFDGIGKVAPKTFHPKKSFRKLANGRFEFWPIDNNGIERKWRYGNESVEEIADLLSIEERDGTPQVILTKETGQYKTVWKEKEYDASSSGKRLLGKFVDTDFPYPKSLYAVMECLRAAIGSQQDALILDFFAGSGTTLHATMLLNKIAGTRHRCVVVTNNEVGPKMGDALFQKNIFPGDVAYEKHGVCESTTWPRVKRAIAGVGRDGKGIPGKYALKGGSIAEGFKENAAFFKMSFLDPHEISRGERFLDVFPLLWLMAGSTGSAAIKLESRNWFIPDDGAYAILFKEERYKEFCGAIDGRALSHIFIVTDSPEGFNEMAAPYMGRSQCIQLYRSYLEMFKVNVPTLAK